MKSDISVKELEAWTRDLISILKDLGIWCQSDKGTSWHLTQKEYQVYEKILETLIDMLEYNLVK